MALCRYKLHQPKNNIMHIYVDALESIEYPESPQYDLRIFQFSSNVTN